MASYSPYPQQMEVRLPEQPPPPQEVAHWLQAFGWTPQGTNLWQKSGHFNGMYYTWSEAIALESLRVLTVGNV
jgi:hypothetical protein